MKTSRKNAALAVMADYNNYEVRPVSFKTIYNRVFWSHAYMLTPEQRRQIEAAAARYAEADKEATAKAKALQEYQRGKYADKAAKYGEC